MDKTQRTRLLIFLSLFTLLVCALAVVTRFDIRFSASAHDVKKVQTNVQKKVSVAQNQLLLAKKMIDSTTLSYFSAFDGVENVYVYKNGKLIYWPNHYFVPAIETNTKDTVLIKNYPSGKYIIVQNTHKKGNDQYNLVTFVPLLKKFAVKTYYLVSQYNALLVGNSVEKITTEPNGATDVQVNGKYLFSVEFKSNATPALFTTAKIILAFSALVSGLLFVFYVALWLFKFTNISKWLTALSISATLFGMIFLPVHLLFNELNTSQITVIEAIMQLLILLCVGGIWLKCVEKLSLKNTQFLRRLPIVAMVAGIAILSAICAFMLYYTSYFLQAPDYSLEFAHLQVFKIEKAITLLFYVLYALVFITYVHTWGKVAAVAINKRIAPIIYTSLVVGIALYLFNRTLNGQFLVIPIALCTALLCFISLYLWPLVWIHMRYVTYLYLFLCIAITSFLASWHTKGDIQDRQNRQMAHIAAKVNNEAEYIDFKKLQSIADSIKTDPFIADIFSNPFANIDQAEQKVVKYYVADYLDKFDCNVYFFNTAGYCLNKTVKRSYFGYYNNYNKPQYKTKYKNLFQINSPGRVYYKFSPITENGNTAGYFALEFTARKTLPNSVFPKLFLEKDPRTNEWEEQPSFAVYKGPILISSSGKFNFSKHVPVPFVPLFANSPEGVVLEGYRCRLFTFEENKNVIIAVPEYSYKRILSNFGLLFFIQGFLLLVFIVVNTGYTKLRQAHTAFTTKIQLYLNIAFFVPLVIVSVTAFTVISRHYKAELEQNFINRAEGISQSLSEMLTQYQKNTLKLEDVSSRLEAVSRVTQTDLLLYQSNGQFLAGTEPKIFELNLLSDYINPQAYKELSLLNQSSFLASESIGKLPFKTVYYAIKHIDSGELIGFLAIPYFDSGKEVRLRVNDAFSTILNVFTVIFMVFLALSYLASKVLMTPLTMLTDKLKQTRLEKMNTPLPYSANDEIGLLVNAYNKMLKKLEESKQVLSATEKEMAWREMAKQVAHEIKNPLTPMKLTLQNILRLQSEKKSAELMAYQKESIKALLSQIDLLSEIATSFSAFSQMPIPVLNKCDIVTILKDIELLFKADISTQWDFVLPDKEVLVQADEKLLIRIVINLVTNAKEAVNSVANPTVTLLLLEENKEVMIKVMDNGTGVEPEHTHKIFEPHFSTKKGGSGIGLAVAKRGIELMGGTLTYSAQPNTTFAIRLPLSE